MQLETGKLILREFKATDIDAVHEYGSDSQVVKFMPWGPNTKEETKNFVDLCITQQFEAPYSKIRKRASSTLYKFDLHFSSTTFQGQREVDQDR